MAINKHKTNIRYQPTTKQSIIPHQTHPPSAYITRWSHNRITQIRKGNMKITPSKKKPRTTDKQNTKQKFTNKKKQTNTRNKYTDPHETPRATQKPCEACDLYGFKGQTVAVRSS